MAMVSRSATGLLNGNIGILRTIVAELVPEKELQPRAFSLLPLIWSIGSIMGPIIGGFLSEPAKKYPTLFPKDSFFDRHPWALPNLFTAALLLNAFVFGFLFVEETLVTKKNRYDPGREIGKKIEAFLSCCFGRHSEHPKPAPGPRYRTIIIDDESRLTSKQPTYSTMKPSSSSASPKEPPPVHHTHHHAPLPWSQVLTPQSIYNISLYFLIAIHVVSYDSILPVFYSTRTPRASNPISLPFHIPGGFNLSTSQIGMIYSANGIVAMVLQFLLYPPIAKKWGSVKLLTISAFIYPVIYFVTPYTLAISNPSLLYASWATIIFLKSLTGVFAFTSSTILITNTASSIRVLGTLNGFATSVAAMGRAMGPSFFGWLFTVGQKGWWTTIPWVGLTFVAGLMWIWIPKLVEGGGLGSQESVEEEEDGEVGEESGGSEDCSSLEGLDVRSGSAFDSDDEDMDEEDVAAKRKARKHGTRRLSMGSVNEQ
ncbi:hypothetical protein ABW19_dt0203634 [Dactylella cylindrospora]|nr:hypothetical protein ABW19_dt0203634 [Dactylella cylindrospora]